MRFIWKNKIRKLKIGDKIKVTSFPRLYDSADGFAAIEGIVVKNNPDEKFICGQGGIILKLTNGGWFVGTGTMDRMKFQLL